MLFDPRIIVEQPLHILAVVAIIMLGKTIAAMGLVLFFRYPINTALTVGASLAQIGEFSFILATLGISLGLLTTTATVNAFVCGAQQAAKRMEKVGGGAIVSLSSTGNLI